MLDGLKDIEAQMDEIVEMHKDLNQLLKEQQPLINRIAKNVARSSNSIRKGTVNIKKARSYQITSVARSGMGSVAKGVVHMIW